MKTDKIIEEFDKRFPGGVWLLDDNGLSFTTVGEDVKDFLKKALQQKDQETKAMLADIYSDVEKVKKVAEKRDQDLIEKIEDLRFCKMIIMTPPKAKKMTSEQRAYKQALKDIIKIIKN